LKVLVLNGPNLASLGRREPEIYGTRTLADLERRIEQEALDLGVEIECRQSNHEGELIDAIERLGDAAQAIIINPGALSHYSLALADALRGSGKPVVEVHISNVFAREPERHRMVTASAATAVICGLGHDGYLAALRFLATLPR
jgi:3-dehydroquinate dehydratase-2